MSENASARDHRESDLRDQKISRAMLHSEAAAIAESASRLDMFVSSALRTRAWGTRRALAYGIAPELTYEELLVRVRSMTPDRLAAEAIDRRSPLVSAEMVGPWWRALGRLVALQGIDTTDIVDGLRIHDIAHALVPVSSWTANEARTYAQLCWVNGRHHRLFEDDRILAALDADDRASVEVDLAARVDGVASNAWNDALARMLAAVSGVTVAAGALTPFDGLRAVRDPDPVEGPLVSVIMSAYRPGPEIHTSVRSILEQSWTNLELIVVDDASGPEFGEIFDDVAALDSRIRVLVQPENRGTYGARNRALPETRGEFVTFQDSDDWSHPERIARQARHLLDDLLVPAVMSRSIRCTPDLTLQLLGYRTTRPNASSLMMRRSTIEELGFFDHVRKSADSEYELRIAAYFGRRVPVLPDLLAFVRLDAGSLSRSDFKPGWIHPTRYAYRESYKSWHEEIERGSSPWLSSSTQHRQFPAPRAFLRNTGLRPDTSRFDLVIAADWREVGALQSGLLQHIHAAVTRDLRIGIMHLESPHLLGCLRTGLCDEIRNLTFQGVATQVLPDDEVDVKLLVVGDPRVLGYAPESMPAMNVERVVVLASTTPNDPATGSHRYSTESVSATVRALWRASPMWIPHNQRVRSALSATRESVLASADVGGRYISNPLAPRTPRGPRPVVGMAVGLGSEDVPLTPEQLRWLLPDDGRVDVRLVAWPQRLSKLFGHVPAAWLNFRPDEVTQRDFYRQLDFYISPYEEERADLVVPRVIAALSAGTITIAHPSLSAVLGAGAIYATASEAIEVARRLFADPGLYNETVTRAQATIRELFPREITDEELAPRPHDTESCL